MHTIIIKAERFKVAPSKIQYKRSHVKRSSVKYQISIFQDKKYFKTEKSFKAENISRLKNISSQYRVHNCIFYDRKIFHNNFQGRKYYRTEKYFKACMYVSGCIETENATKKCDIQT